MLFETIFQPQIFLLLTHFHRRGSSILHFIMLDWSILHYKGSVAVDYGLTNYEACSHRLDAAFTELFLHPKLATFFKFL